MCVIISNSLTKKAKKVERAELINAYISNPDGFGIICENEVIKGKTFSEYSAALDKIIGKRFVLWVRISTGGDSLQPFNIGTDDEPMYIFHNGICGSSVGVKSDTAILAESLKGAKFPDICAYLSELHERGKGRFMICTSNADVLFKVGGGTKLGIWRSNEHHILDKQTAQSYFSEASAHKPSVPKVERNVYNHYGSFYK